MDLQVNGEAYELPEAATVKYLVDQLDLDGRVAVEVNNSIVPRSQHRTHVLHEGDIVEVVTFVGGG